jgi:hypothetical protein
MLGDVLHEAAQESAVVDRHSGDRLTGETSPSGFRRLQDNAGPGVPPSPPT